MAWRIDLAGKCGIVTGAASGIGRAAATHLAAMGARLALVDINSGGLDATAREIQAAGSPPAVAIRADAAEEGDVEQAVARCLAEFKAIDFLVNSHGIVRRTPFLEIQTQEWDLMLGVNLRSCFFFCKAVLPGMKERRQGVIVNVASLAGRSSSILGGVHYTVSKHGLIGLSRHLSREFGPFGIRVNTLCPGATLTPMTLAITPQAEIDRVAAIIPRGRWSQPEEQARVIGFLVSDDSANILGACIDCNGGSLMV
ncbi:MAG: SDR family NAD(P)-dependent oxidoreductase [Desulfobacterales bacterium]